MDSDDLEPRRTVATPKPLDPMSIEELRDYIARLRAEIGRAEAEITRKESVRAGAEALFKR